MFCPSKRVWLGNKGILISGNKQQKQQQPNNTSYIDLKNCCLYNTKNPRENGKENNTSHAVIFKEKVLNTRYTKSCLYYNLKCITMLTLNVQRGQIKYSLDTELGF